VREPRLVFGEDPELYDRARPSYPAALIDALVPADGGSVRVLDVACGTAKATVQLAQRGHYGLAVEADPAMAEVARRRLGSYSNWEVIVSDFEAWEPSPSSFDLVCCAQAWHWIDPNVGFFKAHAALRPRGLMALWWNRPDNNDDDSPLRLAMDATYERLAPELPSRGIGAKGQPGLSGATSDLFEDPRCETFPWSQDYSADEWVDLMRTQSDHRLLPSDKLDALISAIHQTILDSGGVYRHRYVCWCWKLQKR
jgi:SAM-dependent methyltransferase